MIEEYKITQEEYLEMKKTCMKLLKAKLGISGKIMKMGKDFSIKEIALILDKVKVELGETTLITENRNNNEKADPVRKRILELKKQ